MTRKCNKYIKHIIFLYKYPKVNYFILYFQGYWALIDNFKLILIQLT